jgi:protease I
MYNDLGFWYRYYRLKEAGDEVVVVGSGSAEEYSGKAGIPRRPDTIAEHVSAADCDGIVIPGGYALDHMRRHPAMVKLVKDLFDTGKVMAAICHGGRIGPCREREGPHRDLIFCHKGTKHKNKSSSVSSVAVW